MKIFKYPLSITDTQAISIPDMATLLTIQMQHGQPMLWALVDEVLPTQIMRIGIYGTGHEIDETAIADYIATFQDGPLVFHAFELKQ